MGGADPVDLHIAALNSHDGSSAFRILITPIRVVCANTQAAALANHVSTVAIRHTRNATAAVQAAREALGLTFAYSAAFEAEAELLINTVMTGAQFDALTRTVFGTTVANAPARTQRAEGVRVDQLAHLFHDAATQDDIRGTAWAGYQAITEYVDHYAPVRDAAHGAHARATRALTSDEPAKVKRAAWAALTPA